MIFNDEKSPITLISRIKKLSETKLIYNIHFLNKCPVRSIYLEEVNSR